MSELFNTVCYTLGDALIWYMLGFVMGAEIFGGKKHGKKLK